MNKIWVLLLCVFAPLAGLSFATEAEDFCEAEFGAGNSSYTRCVNDQERARALLQNFSDEMEVYCREQWGSDAVEALACYEEQREAKEFLDSLPGGEELTSCREQGAGDYVVIAYCVDENWEEVISNLSLGPLDTPVESPAAPRPSPSSLVVWRYVEDLQGPYRANGLNADAELLIIRDGSTKLERLASLKLTPQGVEYIKQRFADTRVWLEETENGIYLYTQSSAGEWGDRNMQFDQLNLTLVRSGLALSAAPDARYAHFFDSAMVQAKSNRLGLWASR